MVSAYNAIVLRERSILLPEHVNNAIVPLRSGINAENRLPVQMKPSEIGGFSLCAEMFDSSGVSVKQGGMANLFEWAAKESAALQSKPSIHR